MIDAAKALANLATMPGDLIAVPKTQMAELLRELAQRQPSPRHLAMFGLTAQPSGAQA